MSRAQYFQFLQETQAAVTEQPIGMVRGKGLKVKDISVSVNGLAVGTGGTIDVLKRPAAGGAATSLLAAAYSLVNGTGLAVDTVVSVPLSTTGTDLRFADGDQIIVTMVAAGTTAADEVVCQVEVR